MVRITSVIPLFYVIKLNIILYLNINILTFNSSTFGLRYKNHYKFKFLKNYFKTFII